MVLTDFSVRTATIMTPLEFTDHELMDLLQASYGDASLDEDASYHSSFSDEPQLHRLYDTVTVGGKNTGTFYAVPFKLSQLRAALQALVTAKLAEAAQ